LDELSVHFEEAAMTAATYTDAKPRKPAAKPVRARASRAKTTPVVDDEPIFSGAPAYSRIHERKNSRLPLIAGGIAVVATIALVAGTSRTARDAEPFTPTQTSSAPAAVATTPVASAQVASPDAQLIAPAPAPAVRQQARVSPRASTVAPAPLDASQLGSDASASVPAAPPAPAPITVPPVQTAPEVEAAPGPQTVAPDAAALPTTPEPMSNWGASTGAQTILTAV
jgi:hypothetical protein